MYNPLRQTTIERIISAQGSTRPITLSEKINLLKLVIARQEAIEFEGKEKSLADKRAMLAEMEKAERYVASAQEQTNRLKRALYSLRYIGVASYSAEMKSATRATFVKQINERGN